MAMNSQQERGWASLGKVPRGENSSLGEPAMRPGMGQQRWGWVGNGAAKRGWTHGLPGFMPKRSPRSCLLVWACNAPPSVPLDQVSPYSSRWAEGKGRAGSR